MERGNMIKRILLVLALLVGGLAVASAPAQADNVWDEYSNCQISWNPAGPWQTGFYYYDHVIGTDLAIYRLGSEQTGGSSSACEDINFTPQGPNVWNDRTFARVYVCPWGYSCYWSDWVWVGSWGGVIMPGVPNNLWYYIEYASLGAGNQNPYQNMQAWD